MTRGTEIRAGSTSMTVAPRPTIALALGGGGARGLAHILMLEVLDELGIRPKLIVGTSIGAVFAAAYAAGMPASLIRAHTEEILSQRFDLIRQLFSARADPVQRVFNVVALRAALLKPEVLLELILPGAVPATFATLKIPLEVVATDFYAQDMMVLGDGNLRQAIAASMALPVIFQPVSRGGRVLMDGGLVNPLPFDLLAGRADITIAVDVSGASRSAPKATGPGAIEAIVASSQILQRSIVREKLKSARPDILIDVGVDAFHVLEFHRFREVLAAAVPAKALLRSQLLRVLGAETVPALAVPADPRAKAIEPPADETRKRRLPRLALPKRKPKP